MAEGVGDDGRPVAVELVLGARAPPLAPAVVAFSTAASTSATWRSSSTLVPPSFRGLPASPGMSSGASARWTAARGSVG
ncbi:MAG: hypothetical protein U5R31_07235 [Acidimicrobiia bacterium]|nr:hypothetical protein [Acidimicrobiia bacterium]